MHAVEMAARLDQPKEAVRFRVQDPANPPASTVSPASTPGLRPQQLCAFDHDAAVQTWMQPRKIGMIAK